MRLLTVELDEQASSMTLTVASQVRLDQYGWMNAQTGTGTYTRRFLIREAEDLLVIEQCLDYIRALARARADLMTEARQLAQRIAGDAGARLIVNKEGE